jgi:hypothetical protein
MPEINTQALQAASAVLQRWMDGMERAEFVPGTVVIEALEAALPFLLPAQAAPATGTTTGDGLVAIAGSVNRFSDMIIAAMEADKEEERAKQASAQPLVDAEMTTATELDWCRPGTVIGAVDDEFGYRIARRRNYDGLWSMTGDEEDYTASEILGGVSTWRVVGHHPFPQET